MSYIEIRNQIDQLQKQIEAHGPLSPEVKKKIDYKFRLDWNYYSNSMEGNTLTMDETRSVMVGNITVNGKPIKDVLEVKGHDEVISEILKIGRGDVRISETRIKQIHKGIMHEEDPEKAKEIGVWKKDPNYVLNYKHERFDYVPPKDVPIRIHALLDQTNGAIDAALALREGKRKKAMHPLDIALRFHLQYVLIHPFYDGNGRTARILTNLILISFGLPPFWIKTEERGRYMQYLADIQGYGGEPDLFYEFAAGLVLRSQQLMLDAIEGKNIEEPSDVDKEIELFKKSLDSENLVQKKRSPEIVGDHILNSFIPLVDKLLPRLRQFDELFLSHTNRFLFTENPEMADNTSNSYGRSMISMENYPFSFENWHRLNGQNGKPILQFNLDYELKGFKAEVTTQINLMVCASFEEFQIRYTFFLNGRGYEPARTPYDKYLTGYEINSTVSQVIKQILDYLKQSTPKT